MSQTLLVRYGAIPEVARFACQLDRPPGRHDRVVVLSRRGPELGTTLEALRPHSGPAGTSSPESASPVDAACQVLRRATAEDEARHAELRREAEGDFDQWQRRIREWNLELELLDLEWTLDGEKLVLYVLGGRGPETTKLALQAAAAGLAVIEVQPVGPEGPVAVPSGGCGAGGCGCEH